LSGGYGEWLQFSPGRRKQILPTEIEHIQNFVGRATDAAFHKYATVFGDRDP
jgi:hypothetical protein